MCHDGSYHRQGGSFFWLPSKLDSMETYRSGHNELDSKSSCRATGTWVRIPPFPFASGTLWETIMCYFHLPGNFVKIFRQIKIWKEAIICTAMMQE